MLYVPVGAPCNICEKEDPRYSTIMRMKLDGSSLEIYAHGVRNTVGFEGKRPVGYEIFAEGWLQNNKAWGRPVDIIIMQDGSLLVSDDRAGAIYRITYSE